MSYQSRIRKDLDRWIKAGWVEARYKDDILGDIATSGHAWNAAGALSILGAVLLAMSAISFVAANWDAMPKLLAFIFLVAAIWAALLGAGRAFDRDAPTLGHALALLGALLFGAAIALTAQTFNMSSFRNTAVLIWSFGALATAVIIPSRPVLIVATVLGALWVWLEILNPAAPNIMWSYLVVWTLMMAAAARLQSRVSANLLGLALLFWISNAIWRELGAFTAFDVEIIALHPLLYGALALLAAQWRNRGVPGFGVISAWLGLAAVIGGAIVQWPLGNIENEVRLYGMDEDELAISPAYWLAGGPAVLAVAVLSFLQPGTPQRRMAMSASLTAAALAALILPLIGHITSPETIFAARLLIGAAFYALCVALILIGSRDGFRATGTMGIIGFAMQTFYVYWETFEGLLTASVFFLGAGLLLFGLSFALMRWRSTLLPSSKEDAS
ncbi:DUF2157 domain-containing protein [Maricaulis sp.]|uniref:DUF2157 domain-containing protein n=1 Tax=Maricaulis sp. TaxID=1486257 RepID=UPI00261E5537|nr:DUF2157 domain-containing protein [Maricaulis sp.]